MSCVVHHRANKYTTSFYGENEDYRKKATATEIWTGDTVVSTTEVSFSL